MTQMTFFDTPAFTAPTAVASPSTTATALGTSAVTTPRITGSASPRSNRSQVMATAPVAPSSQAPVASEDGLHHMGDLARLVILRYQLIAKRREELAARRPK